ncbi:MAG: YfhO family protein [Lachnospiraceae bacterium]|nr:YfhO family protein [Lachnospiraceae bacterium]
MKSRNHNFYPLIAFLLSIFTFTLFFLLYRCFNGETRTLLRGDLYSQYVDFISMFLRVLKGKESFWYSFSIYFGSGTVLTHAYYSLSPFNLLYLIDTISLSDMTYIIIALKFGLATVTFTLFADRVLKRRDPWVLLFALCYSFNSFSITLYFNIIWLEALYMLPLIVLFLFELVNHGRFLGLTACWFYLFLTNFYMGYIIGIFIAVSFFLLLIFHSSLHTLKLLLQRSILFAFSVLLGAGMCSFVLLPAALYLTSHIAQDNISFSSLSVSILDIINSLFIGEMPELDNRTPLLYCCLPTLLLLPPYFINVAISNKVNILSATLLVFYLLSSLWLPLFMLQHAFDFPNWYAFRFSFCISFVLCALSCRSLGSTFRISTRRILFAITGLLCLYSFMIQFSPLTSRSFDVTNSTSEFFVNLLFFALWLAFFFLYSKTSHNKTTTDLRIRSNNRLTSVLPLFLIIAELSTNALLCAQHIGTPSLTTEEVDQWYSREKKAIDQIKTEDPGLYRISVNAESNHNAPSMFGYAGFNTFSTSDDYPLRHALNSLGICTVNRAIQEHGYTPITYMLFAQKYTIDLSDTKTSEDVISEDVSVPIHKSEYYLPMAYMVNQEIFNYAPGTDPFQNQHDLIYCMTGHDYKFFRSIPLEEIQLENYGAVYNAAGNHIIFYRSRPRMNEAYVSFCQSRDDKHPLYACFTQQDATADTLSPYIAGKNSGFHETPQLSNGCIVQSGGDYGTDEGNIERIAVYFNQDTQNAFSCDKMIFARFLPEQLTDICNDLAKYSFNLDSYHGDAISGSVTAINSRPVFFTTIPSDNGWHAYVDGNEHDIITTMDGAFLALVLSPGTHQIELKYIAPGKQAGLIISLIAVTVFLLVFLYSTYYHKTNVSNPKR